MMTIIQEAKKILQKPQKCILIPLSDLDENARLKALQERMWIWNEEELNTLLNFYDKPYIVSPLTSLNFMSAAGKEQGPLSTDRVGH
ncbi:MAG: hypothetical protein NUV91_10380, partial [Candidatus Omnitrophica bacterium]|nr:hypothetical protein [Candidatus Omnitrophota bacterium]